MRFTFLSSVILLNVMITEAHATSLTDIYFPPKVMEAVIKKHGSDTMFNSYADQLSKMHEPSIYKQCSKEEKVYRFLYLPSFEKPFVITARHNKNKAIITSTMLTEKSVDNTKTKEKTISTQEWQKLHELFSKINFFTLPVTTERRGLDGDDWVFEGCYSGTYHVIDRWTPEPNGEEEALIQLGEYFVRLAELNTSIRPIIVNDQADSEVPCDKKSKN